MQNAENEPKEKSSLDIAAEDAENIPSNNNNKDQNISNLEKEKISEANLQSNNLPSKG